eukprot:gene27399-34108_t
MGLAAITQIFGSTYVSSPLNIFFATPVSMAISKFLVGAQYNDFQYGGAQIVAGDIVWSFFSHAEHHALTVVGPQGAGETAPVLVASNGVVHSSTFSPPLDLDAAFENTVGTSKRSLSSDHDEDSGLSMFNCLA